MILTDDHRRGNKSGDKSTQWEVLYKYTHTHSCTQIYTGILVAKIRANRCCAGKIRKRGSLNNS